MQTLSDASIEISRQDVAKIHQSGCVCPPGFTENRLWKPSHQGVFHQCHAPYYTVVVRVESELQLGLWTSQPVHSWVVDCANWLNYKHYYWLTLTKHNPSHTRASQIQKTGPRTPLQAFKNRVFAKNRYTWSLWCQKQVHSKTKYKSHARSPAIGPRHIVPVFGLKMPWKCQVHLVLCTLSSFHLFWANFQPIRGHTLVPRHVSYDVYMATRTRSRPILHVQADAACWNGMDNGRSISKYDRFQSCLYANDVATSHVVYSYYTVRYSSNTTL